MPDPGLTYRSYCSGRKLDPGLEGSLAEHVAQLHDEDWRSEFKAAAGDIDHGLREAVAALANHEGGEVFLGIRDDDRGRVGTRLRKVDLPTKLRQEGTREDWYVLDLSPLAVQTTEVGLTDPDRRVLVIEVRKALLAALVREDDGTLEWYVRNGSRNRKLASIEWVRQVRGQARARLLRELFGEYKTKVESIPLGIGFRRLDPRIFRLPRYESASADGSLETVLADEDRHLLVGGTPSAHQTVSAGPGLLERFVREGTRIVDVAERELEEVGRLTEGGTGNELRSLAQSTGAFGVATFRSHLVTIGVLEPPD